MRSGKHIKHTHSIARRNVALLVKNPSTMPTKICWKNSVIAIFRCYCSFYTSLAQIINKCSSVLFLLDTKCLSTHHLHLSSCYFIVYIIHLHFVTMQSCCWQEKKKLVMAVSNTHFHCWEAFYLPFLITISSVLKYKEAQHIKPDFGWWWKLVMVSRPNIHF